MGQCFITRRGGASRVTSAEDHWHYCNDWQLLSGVTILGKGETLRVEPGEAFGASADCFEPIDGILKIESVVMNYANTYGFCFGYGKDRKEKLADFFTIADSLRTPFECGVNNKNYAHKPFNATMSERVAEAEFIDISICTIEFDFNTETIMHYSDGSLIYTQPFEPGQKNEPHFMMFLLPYTGSQGATLTGFRAYGKPYRL